MPDAKQLEFGHRLNRIEKHHKKLARGYVTTVNHDGLIIAKPKVRSSGIPIRGIFMCLAAVFLFKAFLLANLGEQGYASRVALLSEGTSIEKIGAYAMTADPLTVWIAGQMEGLVK